MIMSKKSYLIHFIFLIQKKKTNLEKNEGAVFFFNVWLFFNLYCDIITFNKLVDTAVYSL